MTTMIATSVLRILADHNNHPALPRRSAYSLRISVLSSCNLACRYCMPGTVTAAAHSSAWMNSHECAHLVRLLSQRGVHKIRFTGGEPTLRKDLPELVRACATAAPQAMLAITTNGQRPDTLAPLLAAGLSGVTLHLDTLRQERMASLMGGGVVENAMTTMITARDAGVVVKWNVVVQRHNLDELPALLNRARDERVELRFIELMNTGSARDYVARAFVDAATFRQQLVDGVGAKPIPRRHRSDPAALYETHNGQRFGIIASDTEPFCADCDRLRLTADGRLRGCLYQSGGVPLLEHLRAGANDNQLLALIDGGLDDKRSHHPLQPVAHTPFSMADIGG
jgi:GTP 3',8-cyclase